MFDWQKMRIPHLLHYRIVYPMLNKVVFCARGILIWGTSVPKTVILSKLIELRFKPISHNTFIGVQLVQLRGDEGFENVCKATECHVDSLPRREKRESRNSPLYRRHCNNAC